MMKRCLDEKLLQEYIDGELSPELANEAAAHIAACATCAEALADAENETAFFAEAFAPDEQVNVPTAALRARINAAVAQLESSTESNRGRTRGWSFGGLLASLSGLFTFTPQGAAALASVLAVVALALVFFLVQKSQHAPDKTQDLGQVAVVNPTPALPERISNTPKESQPDATPESDKQKTIFQTVKHTPRPANRKNAGGDVVPPTPLKEKLLPGERQYQTAIASLEKTIKMGGDAVLRPAVRIEYERNLALLDSTIGETRRVASANPKDKDAVGFLMSAYQSKIELLTKVADQAQVAALGR